MKKVFIGVGHGGKDSGATSNGLKEKDLNLSISSFCRDELIRHGVNACMSRSKDEDDSLADEIKECNAFAPDYAVEIHNNAGGGDGAEIYHHYGGGKGKVLAQNILNEIIAIGQNSRGLKTKKNSQGKDYFGWIRQTTAPACLVECAFVDNKNDVLSIDTATKRKQMGEAIAKGILKTLGIKWQESEPLNKPADKEKIYRVQVGAYVELKNAEMMLKKLKSAGFDGIIV